MNSTTNVTKSPIYFLGIDISDAIEEYVLKGNLTFDTIEKMLGRWPVIPDSPDTDTRQMAYEEQQKYAQKAMAIEAEIQRIISVNQQKIALQGLGA